MDNGAENTLWFSVRAQIVLQNKECSDYCLKEFFQRFDEAAVLFHGADGYPDEIG